MSPLLGYTETGFVTLGDHIKDVGDSYHRLSELYEHRHALYLALIKVYDNYITPLGSLVNCWKTKVHADGTTYDGWFLLGMSVTQRSFDGPEKKFDISYHLPMKYWEHANVIILEKGPEYDGYTGNDVIERLLSL